MGQKYFVLSLQKLRAERSAKDIEGGRSPKNRARAGRGVLHKETDDLRGAYQGLDNEASKIARASTIQFDCWGT